MSLEIDRDAVDVATVPWPSRVTTPPEGWTWGRHVTHATRGDGYYLIRDRDGATLHAVMRPDVDTVPTEEELEEALSR